MRVTNKVPLSGHPNNIAASRDGRRVYVSIAQAPGAVDVIDTTMLKRVKSIPVKGAVHNTYVTPDGKFVVAGSIAGKNITVIDGANEEPLWVIDDRTPAHLTPHRLQRLMTVEATSQLGLGYPAV